MIGLLQRVGRASVNVVLIGQNLSVRAPSGAGASFDDQVRANVAAFGSIESAAMTSDHSRVASAKGRLRVGP